MMEGEIINAVETVIRYLENQLMKTNNAELERLLNNLYNLKWEILKVKGDQ